MIEAQVQSTTDGAIIHDRALAVVPDARWFDASLWSHSHASPAGGRGSAAFIRTPVGEGVLRHYHRGGLMARLGRDRYLWAGENRTRAFREFRLLVKLANLGLPVPQPLAARYVRAGLHYRADLLTRRIADAHTLAERLAGGTLTVSLAQAVGYAIAAFHRAGAWHADLNAHNVLVDAAGKAWLIDFDRGRLRRPDRAWQEANLARLRRSFDKLGAARFDGFDARFWHPLMAAWHEAMASAGGNLQGVHS